MASLLITAAFAAAVLGIFALAQFMHKRRGVTPERTRKLVHAAVGALALGLPLAGISHWHVLLLCAGFAGLLAYTARRRRFEALHAIERPSHGILYFAAAVYLCYAAQEIQRSYLVYYLPLMIMAASDSLAALCGKRWPLGAYSLSGHRKTLMGSSAFFLSALIISLLMLGLFGGTGVTTNVAVRAALIAAATTLVEALSVKGLDNVTVPLAAAICLQLL